MAAWTTVGNTASRHHRYLHFYIAIVHFVQSQHHGIRDFIQIDIGNQIELMRTWDFPIVERFPTPTKHHTHKSIIFTREQEAECTF